MSTGSDSSGIDAVETTYASLNGAFADIGRIVVPVLVIDSLLAHMNVIACPAGCCVTFSWCA